MSDPIRRKNDERQEAKTPSSEEEEEESEMMHISSSELGVLASWRSTQSEQRGTT
jgi:hypothetical protein